ncbi:MAG: nicotinate (nicotinamide) nucleotide adenylyltransferase [Sumerlaeia bacterium]
MIHQHQSKTIALFGGSFDPIHRAHVMVVLWALQSRGIDQVIVVPTFRHAFGKTYDATFAQRMEMCRLALADFPVDRVVLSNIEEVRGGTSYMIQTLECLQESMPDCRFRLIVGSDISAEVPTWYEGEKLMQLAPLLQVPRPSQGALLEPGMLPHISSSEVRQSLAEGRPVSHLLSAAVEDYITANGLYNAQL